MLRVEGAPEPVGGEDVHAPVSHEGRRGGHRVEDALHARPHPLLRWAATRPSRRVRCTCEVEEVGSLGLVELKRTGQRFQNALRNATRVAALEARVVVDADPGEERHFLSAEARNTPVITVRAQARLLRRDLGSPGGQELADLVSGVHKTRVTPLRSR
jgi:hypothetical protein